MLPLDKKNFNQRDFAFLERLALSTLLHPDMEKRMASAHLLADVRIIYNPPLESYSLASREFIRKERIKFPIRYSVSKVSTHEGLVVLDLRGRKLPKTRFGLCPVPETYIQPVDQTTIIPVLV
jgi:hypothetical protein